jgi:hypothetical protein
MTTDDYRRALDAALREYETVAAQRSALDTRLAQLGQTVGSLMRLCGLTPTVSWGLTDACRMALKSAGSPLTALEVRAQLEAMGFDLSRYTNDLAAIHTVLKRLTESGEVRFLPRAYEKPAYEWKHPVRALAMRRDAVDALLAEHESPAHAGVEPRSRKGRKR